MVTNENQRKKTEQAEQPITECFFKFDECWTEYTALTKVLASRPTVSSRAKWFEQVSVHELTAILFDRYRSCTTVRLVKPCNIFRRHNRQTSKLTEMSNFQDTSKFSSRHTLLKSLLEIRRFSWPCSFPRQRKRCFFSLKGYAFYEYLFLILSPKNGKVYIERRFSDSNVYTINIIFCVHADIKFCFVLLTLIYG